MKNKKRNKIFLLVILLLGISVGFAALATTLKINGSTTIGKNTWNIYWDNIANESGVTPQTATVISDEDTTHKKNIVTFAVTFNQPGDYYEFNVDAVNAGTLDAEILSIEKKYNDTVIPEVEDPNNRVVPAYLKYEVTYADGSAIAIGNKLAKAQDLTSTPPVYTTKTYKIRVEYDKDAVTNDDVNDQVGDVTHEFSFKVDYGQAIPLPLIQLPQGKTADTLAVGDEICINGETKECFDFVRYDGNDAVLLAKYNLNVNGYTTAKGGTETNLQDSEVRGDWYDSAADVVKDYGRVYFNKGWDYAYWHDSSYNINPKYGSSYPLDIYDSDLNGDPEINGNGYVTNDNYTIAYYVERYKSTLEGYGATIKKARLLTYSEATDTLGCEFGTINDYTGPCPTEGDTSFVTRTDFWLGTARNYGYVYRIYFSRLTDELPNSWHGVRPVIVIEKSNLK